MPELYPIHLLGRRSKPVTNFLIRYIKKEMGLSTIYTQGSQSTLIVPHEELPRAE